MNNKTRKTESQVSFNNPGTKTPTILKRPPLPGTVQNHNSNNAISLWELITKPRKVEEYFNKGDLAEKVGVSKRTIYKILKSFARVNLIEIESFNGKKYGIKIINLWLKGWEKIKEKVRWAIKFEQENEYLKSLGRKALMFFSTRDKTNTLKDQDFKKSYSSAGKNNSIKATKDKYNDQLGCVLWNNSTSQHDLMGLVRKFLWKRGQSGNDSPSAKEVNQTACNAVGKWFKDSKVTIKDAIKALEYIKREASWLISLAEKGFGEIYLELRDIFSFFTHKNNKPSKSNSRKESEPVFSDKVYCVAEDGTKFTAEKYDSEREAERAKARYNKRNKNQYDIGDLEPDRIDEIEHNFKVGNKDLDSLVSLYKDWGEDKTFIRKVKRYIKSKYKKKDDGENPFQKALDRIKR